MFELAGAKRVRRSELFESGSEHSASSAVGSPEPPDAVLTTISSLSSVHFEYDFQTRDPIPTAPENLQSSNVGDGDGDGGEEGYEFRLFSTAVPAVPSTTPSLLPDHRSGDHLSSSNPNPTAMTTTRTVSRITIRSPTPVDPTSLSGEGRFVNPDRPQSYYFSNADGGGHNEDSARRRRDGFLAVAMDGNTVLERAQTTKWPGAFLPSRVINISTSKSTSSKSKSGSRLTSTSTSSLLKTNASSTESKVQIQSQTHSRQQLQLRPCRPSKKRRILLRTRQRAVVSAEEAERAKRTARNREKKVKRKEREKSKKMEKGKDDKIVAE